MSFLQQTNKLLASAIPFVLAPTGSMANNGAITLGTALPNAYANAYVYLPANAIVAGSIAGWYFAQFTSTTVGTVYNNPYTSPGLPSIPAQLVPFSTTGPGAYTGSTSAQLGPSFPLDPNTIGPNGVLRMTHFWATPNNVNNKTIQFQIGATNFYSSVLTTVGNTEVLTTVFARGTQALQVGPPTGSSGVGQGSATAFSYPGVAMNTQPGPTIDFSMQTAVATDYVVLEAYLAEFFYGA